MRRIIAASFALFYFYPIANNKIEFFYKPTEKNERLVQACPSLARKTWMTSPVFPHAKLQIYWFALNNENILKQDETKKVIKYKRELVQTPDGGRIAVDWAFKEDQYDQEYFDQYSQETINHQLYNLDKVLIISPGLTGGSEKLYIMTICEEFLKYNYKIAIINSRGVSSSPIDTPITYHYGYTDDLKHVIEQVILKRYPNYKLVGLGTSMGGNIILKYAGEMEAKCPLKGIVAVSTPFDVMMASKSLKRWRNRDIEWYFSRRMIKNIKPYKENFQILEKTKGANINKAFGEGNNCISQRMLNYDRYFIIKMFGYKTTDELYRSVGCSNKLLDIKIPVLAIHAKDDPICYQYCIPFEEFQYNENLILAMTQHGGHLTFLEGITELRTWYPTPAREFLNNLLMNF